jgi:hypothetical protein
MVTRSPALRRRRLAATIGVAWLLAVLILPALHLGHHDHAHEHRADGTIVTVTVTVTSDDHDHGPGAAPHRHDDLADEFSEEDAAPTTAPRPSASPIAPRCPRRISITPPPAPPTSGSRCSSRRHRPCRPAPPRRRSVRSRRRRSIPTTCCARARAPARRPGRTSPSSPPRGALALVLDRECPCTLASWPARWCWSRPRSRGGSQLRVVVPVSPSPDPAATTADLDAQLAAYLAAHGDEVTEVIVVDDVAAPVISPDHLGARGVGPRPRAHAPQERR